MYVIYLHLFLLLMVERGIFSFYYFRLRRESTPAVAKLTGLYSTAGVDIFIRSAGGNVVILYFKGGLNLLPRWLS